MAVALAGWLGLLGQRDRENCPRKRVKLTDYYYYYTSWLASYLASWLAGGGGDGDGDGGSSSGGDGWLMAAQTPRTGMMDDSA